MTLSGEPELAPYTSMKSHLVCCIAYPNLQAEQMVQRLKSEAFPVLDISILSAFGPMIEMFGDIAQGLLNQGIPWEKALLYGARTSEGRTLVSVQVDRHEQIEQVKEIFRKAGANDISASREATQVMYRSTSFRSLPSSRGRLTYA